MTVQTRAKLYSPALLGLATDLARFPLTDDLPLRGAARSRSCGGVMTLGIMLDEGGRIARIGMQVSACAVGQASATLLARGIIGAEPAAVRGAADALGAWLAGDGELPDWPADLAPLVPARAHPGRHGALLMPWKAACEALSTGAACR
ncbi:iron-sulfur cluster assembly scaffold protein [Porphyrobacter sp. TH134]|uniref:iron-sulfur cluster assembly scaffold protein n=1 Tax=Porphyrobacter sp. TH134 TaxID=2067450 RepID=UPI001F471439|nr:iron-sulfur cluster assembly scaffold protein [Porphyrobacter sp. TH134]